MGIYKKQKCKKHSRIYLSTSSVILFLNLMKTMTTGYLLKNLSAIFGSKDLLKLLFDRFDRESDFKYF